MAWSLSPLPHFLLTNRRALPSYLNAQDQPVVSAQNPGGSASLGSLGFMLGIFVFGDCSSKSLRAKR